MSRAILVVAAHPDDEVLGCGGAIARHAVAGDSVHLVFLADGVSARQEAPDTAAMAVARRRAAESASSILGAAPPAYLGFPDNRLDTVPLLDVVQAVEDVTRDLSPDVVYTHHAGDLNVDHRTCLQAVLTAFRPFPGQSVRAVYGFEVCSSTEWAFHSIPPDFRPTRYVDVSAFFEQKLAALDAYAAEMRAFPHARSIEAVRALAAWRGACVGLEKAEAFTTIREIV